MNGVNAKVGNVGPFGTYTIIRVDVRFLTVLRRSQLFHRLIKHGVAEMCECINQYVDVFLTLCSRAMTKVVFSGTRFDPWSRLVVFSRAVL
jgi:hypothetical protein